MNIDSSVLEDWDGKRTAHLQLLADKHRSDPSFVDALVEALVDTSKEAAASWIIKNLVDGGHSLTTEAFSSIVDRLDGLTSWPAQLHILQIIDKVEFTRVERDRVEKLVRKTLASENKFVRAWSYNAFGILAEQHPELRGECLTLFEHANSFESASVKARIRDFRKGREW